MKKRFSFTSYSNQYLPPLKWLFFVGSIVVLAIWMLLGISELFHWEGNNFLFHGGIWVVTMLILYAGVNFCGAKAVDLRIRALPTLVIPMVMLLTVVFALGAGPLHFLQPIDLRGMNPHPFGLTPNPLTFILFVILLPLIEEFFFRGMLLGHMLLKLNVTKAIVISSFFYSLAQWGNEHLLTALLLGVVSGLLYVTTRSLFSSIIFHIAWNFLIFFSWLDGNPLISIAKNQLPDDNGRLLFEEVGLALGMIAIFYLMHRIVLRQNR
ncbi:hypothetical protein PbJCM13498_12850 [Prolixibacter bellariivorans]|uniref:CAAX prenyl protease 2/Lysostaphin resistance protein A-like domain-containing protein n=1 Tax=Prolixibacter bellariivorans TaxID=314319 RepID=A0A5M4AWZ8_9BACT|nr:CPBP family intramembrane glutamic endopeptidase [Prolixibacter bellariivorans]GET32422.1 hypothetical protein PbJCM13498_12850 [Prolixibacter bellariivorans]